MAAKDYKAAIAYYERAESFVDDNIKGKMYGIGTNDMLGIIPYLEVKFENVTCAANFYVMDDRDSSSKSKDLILLGFPFMMFYKIKLDFCAHTQPTYVNII